MDGWIEEETVGKELNATLILFNAKTTLKYRNSVFVFVFVKLMQSQVEQYSWPRLISMVPEPFLLYIGATLSAMFIII